MPAPTTPDEVCALLSRFGALRPQPASDWNGEGALPPELARLYAEVGPMGEAGALLIPHYGNEIRIPSLSALWALQEGYRWNGRDGRRLPDWPDHWLVVAEQGGDPFILDREGGAVLHARHGEGAWNPAPLFPGILAAIAALGTFGALHEEAGEDLLDESFEPRPAWRAELLARLGRFLGPEGAARAAERLEW
ncbi:hypothetical protein VQH23_08975 [Pararoseomonas sp. SCSIO 73927]|uniref:hypothetical protein n=1 Tax=Pararoseomonas sp. SCSIO 73927 TaxID=3114537 RepID=UPI0030CAA30E